MGSSQICAVIYSEYLQIGVIGEMGKLVHAAEIADMESASPRRECDHLEENILGSITTDDTGVPVA